MSPVPPPESLIEYETPLASAPHQIRAVSSAPKPKLVEGDDVQSEVFAKTHAQIAEIGPRGFTGAAELEAHAKRSHPKIAARIRISTGGRRVYSH
jgi:hypothetical protein